jgi:hypothetical protein
VLLSSQARNAPTFDASLEDNGASTLLGCRRWLASHEGVEVMNKLVEIRSQEAICRERAALDSERRLFWLAKAEEWEQRALDEIAYHFRECNLVNLKARSAATS